MPKHNRFFYQAPYRGKKCDFFPRGYLPVKPIIFVDIPEPAPLTLWQRIIKLVKGE